MYQYKHPRPAVSVDIAIFMPGGDEYRILLVQRAGNPYQGMYALPGGFVDLDESLEQAACRELREETGLENIKLTQVHTFSEPNRDPRGRVITTCFAGILTDPEPGYPRAGSDAKRLDWFPLSQLPDLAFDHHLILMKAVKDFLAPRG